MNKTPTHSYNLQLQPPSPMQQNLLPAYMMKEQTEMFDHTQAVLHRNASKPSSSTLGTNQSTSTLNQKSPYQGLSASARLMLSDDLGFLDNAPVPYAQQVAQTQVDSVYKTACLGMAQHVMVNNPEKDFKADCSYTTCHIPSSQTTQPNSSSPPQDPTSQQTAKQSHRSNATTIETDFLVHSSKSEQPSLVMVSQDQVQTRRQPTTKNNQRKTRNSQAKNNTFAYGESQNCKQLRDKSSQRRTNVFDHIQAALNRPLQTNNGKVKQSKQTDTLDANSHIGNVTRNSTVGGQYCQDLKSTSDNGGVRHANLMNISADQKHSPANGHMNSTLMCQNMIYQPTNQHGVNTDLTCSVLNRTRSVSGNTRSTSPHYSYYSKKPQTRSTLQSNFSKTPQGSSKNNNQYRQYKPTESAVTQAQRKSSNQCQTLSNVSAKQKEIGNSKISSKAVNGNFTQNDTGRSRSNNNGLFKSKSPVTRKNTVHKPSLMLDSSKSPRNTASQLQNNNRTLPAYSPVTQRSALTSTATMQQIRYSYQAPGLKKTIDPSPSQFSNVQTQQHQSQVYTSRQTNVAAWKSNSRSPAFNRTSPLMIAAKQTQHMKQTSNQAKAKSPLYKAQPQTTKAQAQKQPPQWNTSFARLSKSPQRIDYAQLVQQNSSKNVCQARQMVMRQLGLIDYSMLNDLERVRAPTATQVQLGLAVVQFVHIVKCASMKQISNLETLLDNVPLSNLNSVLERDQLDEPSIPSTNTAGSNTQFTSAWKDIIFYLRQNVACSMYQFKDNVRKLVNPQNLSSSPLPQSRQPKHLAPQSAKNLMQQSETVEIPEIVKNAIENLKQNKFTTDSDVVKTAIAKSRVLRALTLLTWGSICVTLNLSADQASKFDDVLCISKSTSIGHVKTPTQQNQLMTISATPTVRSFSKYSVKSRSRSPLNKQQNQPKVAYGTQSRNQAQTIIHSQQIINQINGLNRTSLSPVGVCTNKTHQMLNRVGLSATSAKDKILTQPIRQTGTSQNRDLSNKGYRTTAVANQSKQHQSGMYVNLTAINHKQFNGQKCSQPLHTSKQYKEMVPTKLQSVMNTWIPPEPASPGIRNATLNGTHHLESESTFKQEMSAAFDHTGSIDAQRISISTHGSDILDLKKKTIQSGETIQEVDFLNAQEELKKFQCPSSVFTQKCLNTSNFSNDNKAYELMSSDFMPARQSIGDSRKQQNYNKLIKQSTTCSFNQFSYKKAVAANKSGADRENHQTLTTVAMNNHGEVDFLASDKQRDSSCTSASGQNKPSKQKALQIQVNLLGLKSNFATGSGSTALGLLKNGGSQPVAANRTPKNQQNGYRQVVTTETINKSPMRF